MRFTPEYKQYLKSPQWEARRQMYFAKNGRRCQACGKIGGHIVVHHLTYDNFMREPMADLVGLCNPCHVEVHRRHRAGGRQDLRAVTMRYIMEKRKR